MDEEVGNQPVAADEIVYRRLSDSSPNMLVVVDRETGSRRPSSGAFKPDDDGVSVYRQVILASLGLGAADIVVKAQNLVVSLPVADIRTIDDLDVMPDPWPSDVPDPTHARNAAHALIAPWSPELSKGQRLKLQQALAELASLHFVVG